MSLSSRLFLLDDDDMAHRLPVRAFHRLLLSQSTTRVPDFANQRARLASVVVEMAGSVVLGVRRLNFDLLEFDGDGRLDARRYGAQQAARLDSMVSAVMGETPAPSGVIDATDRFKARGGAWTPGPELRRRIEAAACGREPTAPVRVLG